jgi:hypothetical protein
VGHGLHQPDDADAAHDYREVAADADEHFGMSLFPAADFLASMIARSHREVILIYLVF